MLKIKKFKPVFTGLLTTMDVYDHDVFKNGLLVIKKGTIKEYQKVLATGDTVRNTKVGDLVLIDPKNYIKMKHSDGSLRDGVVTDNMAISYDFELLEIDGKLCMHLQDRDIRGIIEEYEEVPDIEIPSQIIITPEGIGNA